MLKKSVFLIVVLMSVLSVGVSAGARPSSLSSASAVLYEPCSGRFLYEKDADTPRPMASTTKLMTALVASRHLPLDATVTIPPQAVLVEGSSMGLRGGDRLTVEHLLTGLLLSSGNDAANALAMLSCGSLPAFADSMNRTAAELGMTRSLFVTPSGLDEGGHSSTARDMALLGAAVLQQPSLADICAKKTATVVINDVQHTLSNHNRLLSLYPSAIGLKTGYTMKSGKCLVSAARRDGVTLIAVTLNGGDYWNDHIALYEYGFSVTASVPLAMPALPPLSVAGGEQTTVPLSAEQPPAAILMKDEADAVSVRVQLPSFVWAPVTAGETVGQAVYTVGDRVIGTVPLKAAQTVVEREPWSFFEKWKRAAVSRFTEWVR